MNKRIGIIGTRERDSQKDFDLVIEVFTRIYKKGDSIVSGGCPKGGDKFAEMISDIFNTPKNIFKPNMKLYDGLAKQKWMYTRANFERNTKIAQNSDVLIACVGDGKTFGRGTQDTIDKFTKFWKETKPVYKV